MNIPANKHSTAQAHQQRPTQKASEPANSISLYQPRVEVVADEASFTKIERRPLMTIGLLTVMLMLMSCSKPDVKDPRLQPQKVEISKAEAANSGSKTFTGIVEARVQSNLGFRVGGKIMERSVDVGQRVQKGQTLMVLDSIDFRLAEAAEQAAVEAARAKYTEAKADEARLAGLLKPGAISRQQYDQARAALDSSKAQLDAAEAQAKVSANSREYAVLSAPADGVIVNTLSEPGQVVAAGQTVMRLAQDGPREAAINLPEGLHPNLESEATARLYGYEKTYQAKLRQLSDAADPASRTFEARYVLEGAAASAPLGSTVSITLAIEQASEGESILVPVGAIHDSGSGPGVWIVNEDSGVKFRSVKIASIGKETIVISEGVKAGENVVALGAHLLHEGQAITWANKTGVTDAKF